MYCRNINKLPSVTAFIMSNFNKFIFNSYNFVLIKNHLFIESYYVMSNTSKCLSSFNRLLSCHSFTNSKIVTHCDSIQKSTLYHYTKGFLNVNLVSLCDIKLKSSKASKITNPDPSSSARNFITPIRAMNEYLLKPNDLADLRKFQRRSPYENEPPITVYLRKDVEAKALQVWNSWETLQRVKTKRKEEEQRYIDSIFHVKKLLKEFKRQHDPEAKIREEILRGSGRVVITAVFINGANFLFKTFAWLYTGSHSLFAEAIHSLADTVNQLILLFGIRKSLQTPNEDHPYGYHPMRYIASLISGVGIFCAGTGLSFYHGIHGLLNPEQMESLYWAFFILGGSLISEGGTLLVAINAARKGAIRAGMTIKEYVYRSHDPSVNVVLLEDLAAVVGVLIAGTCMGLTSYFNTHIYDAAGSLLVGGLLGVVASFIIYTNSGALVGRSIPLEKLQEINKHLEADEMIRAIHDVKATDMGNEIIRYKAELDFDGRRLTRHYLDSLDMEALLKEMQSVQTIEDVEAFILKHGENIVDLLGAEIDRIEKELKKKHPRVRHVDLEVL